jgi:hypothetical protein
LYYDPPLNSPFCLALNCPLPLLRTIENLRDSFDAMMNNKQTLENVLSAMKIIKISDFQLKFYCLLNKLLKDISSVKIDPLQQKFKPYDIQANL